MVTSASHCQLLCSGETWSMSLWAKRPHLMQCYIYYWSSFIFFLILNTALDLSMLVQEGTICVSAKEICAPWKSTEQLAGWMKGETEQFLQDREYICCFRCFTGCAWEIVSQKTWKRRIQKKKLSLRSAKLCLSKSCFLIVFFYN